MRKEQKHEIIRILLYSFSGLIVGCAVGGALLMKVMTEGDTRRAQAEAAAAARADAVSETELPPAVTLPAAEPVPEPIPEPVAETVPPPDADALRELLKPAEPMFTASYCYTDSDCYETHSEVWGRRVPFSTDSVIITCDGTICMSVDAGAIGYAVDPESMQITVTLPEPQIISHELDEDSIQYYDVKSSLFRSPSFADYTALIREIKSRICDRIVQERDFGGKTLENAETVIRSCFSVADLTKEYQVLFALPETEPVVTEPAVTAPPEPEETEPEPDEPEPEDSDYLLFPFFW